MKSYTIFVKFKIEKKKKKKKGNEVRTQHRLHLFNQRIEGLNIQKNSNLHLDGFAVNFRFPRKLLLYN